MGLLYSSPSSQNISSKLIGSFTMYNMAKNGNSQKLSNNLDLF